MRDELIEKLNNLLHRRTAFCEAETVYLLVEARKLMDRQKDESGRENTFPLLRFYADWSVHTAKNRQLTAFQVIAERIAAAVPEQSSGDGDADVPNDRDYAYMTELREEMANFFQTYGIRHRFSSDKVWTNFVGSLVAVLHDQPIERPTPDIAEIRIETSAFGSAVWVVTFTNGRPMMRLGTRV